MKSSYLSGNLYKLLKNIDIIEESKQLRTHAESLWSVEFKWHGELTIQAQLPITTAAVLHQWVGREQKNPDWFRSFLLPTTYMASFIDPMPNLLWFFSPPKTDLDYRQWKNTHLS